MPKLVNRDLFLNAVTKEFGSISQITRAQVLVVCSKNKMKIPAWLVNDQSRRIGRGAYSLLSQPFTKDPKVKVEEPVAVKTEVIVTENIDDTVELKMAANDTVVLNESLVPQKLNGFVKFGNYEDVNSIVKSARFFPTYITGLSGNGKTLMVQQVCAVNRREMIRVNITKETDEDALIGGFRLIDGHTVWQNGPVIIAMERGAILLLDEIDLGGANLMCLQPILEGNAIYLKKINKVVAPRPGFNIIATANTKGKGSEDGRFIGTNVMNEAFLERFSITLEQEYPSSKVELKILDNKLGEYDLVDKDFTTKLTSWAEIVRKSFEQDAVPDVISTRRLCHIIDAFAIFGQDRKKSVTMCLNRFDKDTKSAFIALYQKLDENWGEPLVTPAVASYAPEDSDATQDGGPKKFDF